MSAVVPDPAVPTSPALEFAVLGVEYVRHAAAPTLRFELQAVEPAGREVYTVALSVQIHVDPARRTYDEPTREKLAVLFGAPERWGATTHSFMWSRVAVLLPTFSGETTFELLVPCTYDQEIAATRYFSDLPDGEAPLTMHFSGTVFYQGADGGIQVVQVPWSASASFGLPVAIWRDMIAHHYPHAGWIALHEDTLAALLRRRTARGLTTLDATVARLLEETPDG